MRRQNYLLWLSIRHVCISTTGFFFSISIIYHSELEISDTTNCSTSASYLDILLKWNANGKLKTFYDKRDDIYTMILRTVL
jgi:hypothetical protein